VKARINYFPRYEELLILHDSLVLEVSVVEIASLKVHILVLRTCVVLVSLYSIESLNLQPELVILERKRFKNLLRQLCEPI
jgi:hypothetical protein